MPKLHLKTGDLVRVIAGNDKGKQGKVLRTFPTKQRAIVEGIHLLTHYRKPTQADPKGGMERTEAPVHISNLMVLDPKTAKPTRIGRKRNEQGKLQRYAKQTGNLL